MFQIPAAAMTLLGSNLDWQYDTLPNNVSCLSSVGQQCRFSRGKCLGGSTSINYMLYTRGNRQDYDDYNIPGWTWQDLEPYFLRYEGLQILDQLPASSNHYHNSSGIMKIEFFDDPENPWQEIISQGFKTLGFQFNADVNGVSQIGVTRNTGYVYKGERMSTARAYLGKCKVKRKLRVAKNAYCTGVIFDDEKVAKGVTVVQGLITKRIYARKEVILSAGTVETPKILMLSGIGPAEHLQKMGIPVVADLNVGDNMSDHVLPLLFVLVDEEVRGILENILALLGLFGNAVEFLARRAGPLASNGLADLNVFVNTSCYNSTSKNLETGPSCELPTMQLIPAYIDRNLATLGKTLIQNSINLDDNVIEQIAEINSKYAVMVISPIVLKPFSRGYIRLASRNPLDRPAIFPNYLSDSRDADEMLRSIGIVEDLIETAVFKMHEAKLFHLKFPGCPSYEEGREEYWRCYINHMTYSVFHAVGTLDKGNEVEDITGLFELIGNAAEFLESRDGPLASNGLVDLNVFANTSCYNSTSKKLEARPGCELPTMQLIPAYIDKKLVTLGKTLVQNSIHLDDNVIDQIAEINSEYAVMVFSPVVLNPCSQGYIRLASRNPLDHPAIFANYLSDSRDADEMLRSIGIIEDLIETTVFKMHEAKLFHLKFPGCPIYEEGREEYWRCYIKHMTYSVFHAVGTCSLQTCVDTRLRVKGVRGLRVADASIFPRVMRGNTAAPTIAVGERVVDFIMEEN
ncbi:Uncharacterized protein OBRU01_04522 [Operophtera brumata]|uniref:Glucose-methanol-choline oxidoreductase N-terminal domain-containing protein n=1 Tax=Operophtera brumata TaxID=104452 RepID=A0A0L7LNY9_OPEBR|nr:Uncharacterized protein OBRU01_04522 [Operophtera brumata]